MPDDEEPLSANKDEVQECLPVIGIDVFGEILPSKECVQSIFDMSKANIYNPIIECDVCNAYWAQKDSHENELVRITSRSFIRATHDLRKLREICN